MFDTIMRGRLWYKASLQPHARQSLLVWFNCHRSGGEEEQRMKRRRGGRGGKEGRKEVFTSSLHPHIVFELPTLRPQIALELATITAIFIPFHPILLSFILLTSSFPFCGIPPAESVFN